MNTQEKAQCLADFWASVARGEKWEFLNIRDQWTDYAPESGLSSGPNMHLNLCNWRRKPEPIVRWTVRHSSGRACFQSEIAARQYFGDNADLVKLVEAE